MDIRHAVGVKAGVPAEKLANLLNYRDNPHFSEPELVELTFIAGFQIFASKFAKAFRIAPQGFSA